MNFEETLTFIKAAHAGQKYGKKPYWTHPLAVANRLNTDDEELKIIALLHDVVEDTHYTFEDLSAMGYSDRVIAALRLLTKDPRVDNDEHKCGDAYQAYLYRLTDGMQKPVLQAKPVNMDAVVVKLADNAENSAEKNLKDLKPARQERLRAKYRMGKWMILSNFGMHVESDITDDSKVGDFYVKEIYR